MPIFLDQHIMDYWQHTSPWTWYLLTWAGDILVDCLIVAFMYAGVGLGTVILDIVMNYYEPLRQWVQGDEYDALERMIEGGW